MIDAQSLLVMEIERFAVQDGPGIRTAVFLKGCEMRCPWCANPESQRRAVLLMHDGTACVRCGACARACPSGAVAFAAGEVPVFDRARCNACAACARVCPAGAITYSGTWMTPEQIMQTVLRDKDYYAASGGGLTLSGGEPLLWGAALLPLLAMCRENAVSVAVETCGQFPPEHLPPLLPYLGLLLFDVKHADAEKLGRVAGGHSETILENLDAAVAFGVPVTVRIPVIPDFNHTQAEMAEIFRLIKAHGVRQAELLPYHTLGKNKYAKLGLPYTLGAPMLAPHELEPYRALGEALGLAVKIGG